VVVLRSFVLLCFIVGRFILDFVCFWRLFCVVCYCLTFACTFCLLLLTVCFGLCLGLFDCLVCCLVMTCNSVAFFCVYESTIAWFVLFYL